MENIKVNYHASICIQDEVYIDPFNIIGKPHNAKLVCITHSHWDHLSIEDIKKVSNKNTHFVAPQDCIDILIENGFEIENQKNYWAVAGKSFDNNYNDNGILGYKIPNDEISLLAFPSYNIDKPFHKKESGWVGYIITIKNIRYVVCGDSDFTPELKKIKCDVLFVPIGGTYTMNAKVAAECTNHIMPKIVVPIHYLLKRPDNTTLGSKEDEVEFLRYLDNKINALVLL